MKKFLYLICFLVCSGNNYSQSLNWAFTNLPNNGGKSEDLKLDSQHNLYTACTFFNAFDPDGSQPSLPISGQGGYDSYLGKYNLNGQYLWGFVLGSNGDDFVHAITVDNSDNLYSTGTYYDTLDCDPSAATKLLYPWPGTFSYQSFVAKYNSAGQFVWAGSINSKQDVESYDIQFSSDGFIYVSGVIKDTTDFDLGSGIHNVYPTGFAGFIAKYDLNGQFIRVNLLEGNSYCVVKAMAVDNNLNLLITGQNGDSIDMDPGPGDYFIHAHSISNDVFVGSYNSVGNINWAFSFGGAFINDLAKSIDVDQSGNCYVTGLFYNTIDLDPGPGVLSLTTTTADQDIYLASYTSSGNIRWGKSIYGYSLEGPGDVKISAAGNVYVTGSFTGRLDFDSTQTGFIMDNSPSATQDVYVAKYNTTGNFLHAYNIGGLNTDAGFELAIGPSEENIVGGYFRDTVNFQLGTLIEKRYGGMNGAVFFASYSECSVTPVSVMDSICIGQSYPFGYLSIDTSGIYVQVMKSATGCDSVVTLNMIENPLPSITAHVSDSVICSGDSVIVWATGEPDHFWFTPGINDSVLFAPTSTSSYTVQATNAHGCNNFSSAEITVNPAPAVPEIFASGDTLFIIVFGSSYQWFLNGIPLTNSNNYHITATSAGNYSATVTNNFGCSNTSQSFLFTPSLVEMNTNFYLKIFPNPTHDKILIKGTDHSEKIIKLMNVQGIVLMEKIMTDELSIDISPFADGIYFLQTGNIMNRVIKF